MVSACSAVIGLDRLPGGADDGGADDAAPDAARGSDATPDVLTSDKFAVEVNPSPLFLDPGEKDVAISVKLTRASGFSSPVSFSVSGLPSGVSASMIVLTAAETSGSLVLEALPGAAPSASNVSIVGVAGDDAASVPLSLFVTGEIVALTSDGAFVVPSPAPPLLDFHLWGAGGGGGGANREDTSLRGGAGGAGGWAGGRVAVASGDTFDIRVGRGGGVSSSSFGGGAGGGYTSVRRGDALVLLAGGGGGGGSGFADSFVSSGGAGGAGGGAEGEAGGPFSASLGGGAGGGGSATAGGVLDTCWKQACDGTAPTPGASLVGGKGGYRSTPASFTPGGEPGGGAAPTLMASGGGGGGGWFGGGGGGFVLENAPNNVARGRGGGGGSGFVGPLVLPVEGATLETGKGSVPPRTSDPRYRAGVAVGGMGKMESTPASAGANGLVAIVIARPPK